MLQRNAHKICASMTQRGKNRVINKIERKSVFQTGNIFEIGETITGKKQWKKYTNWQYKRLLCCAKTL